jgi:hypothetical protein
MTNLRETDAMTISIGAPEVIDGKEGRRVLAAFYAGLLGMREFEPWGWLRLSVTPPSDDYMAGRTTSGAGSRMGLALGDGWSDQRPPRWPADADFPQQLHFDVAVPDLVAGGELVTGLGGRLLEAFGDHLVCADPAGHPLCLYPDVDVTAPELRRLVLDCFSPRSLATFYEGFLGVSERLEDTPERVVLALGEELPDLAFQHAVFVASRWPDPAYPAQLHVDWRFTDGADPAVERAERLGGIRVYAKGPQFVDPAGHPFCL